MPPTVIPAAGANPFPFDPARTAIVQLYHEPGMIADRVLPATPPLGMTRFEWFRYRIEDAFEIPDLRLGRKSTPNVVEFEGEEVQDRTEHYGLQDFIPTEDMDAARTSAATRDPADSATLQMTHLLKLGHEVRVASLVFAEASYSADYRKTPQTKFDQETADPLGDLEEALNTPILRPNVVVFGQPSWSRFRRHPKVLSAVNIESGSESGLASRQAVAGLLEVDEVLVGRSRVATLGGENLTLKRAWGKSIACIYRGAYANSTPSGTPGSERQEGAELTASLSMQTFGFTAVYEPLNVYTRTNEGRGIKGGTEIQVRESCKEVIAGGNGFGFLLHDVIA